MDNEAVSILADYLDRYYNDSSVSEEEIFSNAFAKTADRIMTVTRSPVVPVAVWHRGRHRHRAARLFAPEAPRGEGAAAAGG